ncbi:MAG: hypothetical protein D6781_06080 [Verrucomicrobia bacterium]|nr:MAG: hypothetical protein D6781_06080 [Verrucomicrobiota bacterium]
MSFLLAFWGGALRLAAQGSLEPPGAPAPTQKSLQEIWDEVADLKSGAISSLEGKVDALAAQVAALKSESEAREAAAAQQAPFWDHIATVMGAVLPWEITEIADTQVGSVASMRHSLAFSPDGQPAVAFYDDVDGTTSALKFATFDGSAWQVTTVATDVAVGRNPSLAFSPSGEPAIACLGDGDVLKFYVRSNGLWTVANVAGNIEPTAPVSLVYLSNGLPRIGVQSAFGTSVVLVSSDPGGAAGSWTTETAFSSSAEFTGLVVDALDRVWCFANNPVNKRFKYRILKTVGGWEPEAEFAGHGSTSVYANEHSVGVSLSLRPYVVPSLGPSSAVVIYRDSGDGWISHLLDNNPFTSQTPPAIAFSPARQPCVAYFDGNSRQIIFATHDGENWHHQPVTNESVAAVSSSNPASGAELSLAFSPDGRPAIVYHDAHGRIYFAIRQHLTTP